MRFLRILIPVLVLVATQVHACVGTWALPGGERCVECPRLERASGQGQRQLAAKDCRQCCTYLGCSQNDDGKARAAARTHFTPVAVFAPYDLVPPTPVGTGPKAIFIGVASFFANGPPTSISSRAPPSPVI